MTRNVSTQDRAARRWWIAIVPAAIAALPLVGMSFHGDERPRIYAVVNRTGSNPLEIARATYDDIQFFLSLGNFRPLGRFLEAIEHAFVFEAGEVTGLAPHVVHGVVRLLMVVLLAYVAASVVAALARSAGVANNHPALVLYPLALGAVLVANGSHSPDAVDRWYVHITLVNFPHTLIGAVVALLAIALVVARDRDMRYRRLSRRELVAMALLGAAAAATYDLLYLAPVVAAAFVVARALAAGAPVRSVLATAAARRWAAMSLGFLVILVPVRLEIARRCASGACYIATDVSLSVDALDQVASRLAAGLPPAGWRHNAGLSRHFGLELGLAELAANALTGLLLVAVAVLTVVAAIRVAASGTGAEDGRDPIDSREGQRRSRRLAMALASFGGVIALLSVVAASLSRRVQQIELRFADAWRETLLTQVAWSFVIAAGATAAVCAVRSRGPARIAAAVVAAALGAALTLTLFANWRLAQTDRTLPFSSVTSQISAATVNIDATDSGNAYRCSLIDGYSQHVPDNINMGGPAVRAHLDQLMLDRHGMPFCDPESAERQRQQPSQTP